MLYLPEKAQQTSRYIQQTEAMFNKSYTLEVLQHYLGITSKFQDAPAFPSVSTLSTLKVSSISVGPILRRSSLIPGDATAIHGWDGPASPSITQRDASQRRHLLAWRFPPNDAVVLHRSRKKPALAFTLLSLVVSCDWRSPN